MLKDNPLYLRKLESVSTMVSDLLGLDDGDIITATNLLNEYRVKGLDAIEILDEIFKSNDVSIENKFLIFFTMGITCSESVRTFVKNHEERMKQDILNVERN